MGLRIIWSDFANKQLENIFNYYLIEAGRGVAIKIATRITEKVSILSETPLIGAKEELLLTKLKEYRYLVERNYKIIYRITKEDIVIVSIFDCRQNPKKLTVKD
jgi:plasmid stabilization system protein ParE